ncbi:NAD-dependent epimerase/dehydratase family protein [Mycolicibacterium sp. CH28]|uniref:carboxylic acid reductase n=1 Tax=Mycolicibacterium sp. CH28 TaxID=2512237 RepID=UPI00108024BB|nr:carboxylic acid reductase [Mycolicibacterium sp. CH28]TGD90659.1 NAD-dependent epimerase/dehydratase family protein [Mycolicibacterium sp. CH28]
MVVADFRSPRENQLVERVALLYTHDEQFRNAPPDAELDDAVSRPGLRLAPLLETLIRGYGDRPALGQRARELHTDPGTGRTSALLLPRFDTISYRELWSQVQAIAAELCHHRDAPVAPGDLVATIGFASPHYLAIDLVCAYLGLVTVPMQHNAAASRMAPIITEAEPKILAVSAEYLDLAIESALGSRSVRRLLVFDYRAQVEDHRDALARSRQRLADAGMPVIVDILDDVIEAGSALPPEPLYTDGSDERLAMIMYTSGSTGAPKGAMYTEAMLRSLWTSEYLRSDTPVFNVNFMPLNHLGGRLPLVSSFLAGGTSYFVPESDMSTLFEDWALVRPTDLPVVPRVVDMLFQRYRSVADRLIAEGIEPAVAESQALAEIREGVLGGRVLTGFVGTAPLAAEMKVFLDECLGVHVGDGYGLSELGMVSRDGVIARPPVTDYKLIDVPELGYFATDKPYPRGELLVKSNTAFPGYYKRPEVTADAFDADGYYRTGDVMAEIAPDHLEYVDRRNNVLKLSQGEFVAVARLEAIFAGAPLVRQIYVYGNSERASVLAVIVPTAEALLRHPGAPDALKADLHQSLRDTAKLAELQSYEVPADFLVEYEPFSADNGLLSGVGKNLRPRLKDCYGAELEKLYADLAAAQVDEIRSLRENAGDRPVIDTVARAATALLGTAGAQVDARAHFTDLGGDSLSALTFANLLGEVFGVEVPVSTIINPTSTLGSLAELIERESQSASSRPSFATVHGRGAAVVRASDLRLGAFIDATTLATAPGLPHATGTPRTVLLTGANGWLGRFLALEWLQRLAETSGTLIALVRGRDDADARRRLDAAFDTGDVELRARFDELAAQHLEVIAGDISEPNLGLDPGTWNALAQRVDQVVHPAALVNHVLPYSELFGPNVTGTAEVIRLALTARIKPVTYLSTVAVAMTVDPANFAEDGDIRTFSARRPVDGTYANGYANSKWAGEVLLRQAHDLCALPVAVFRSDMILAHSRYTGQLNVPDAFTRLMVSLLGTGIAPGSFYAAHADGQRPRAHYDGLPVDFIAEAITTIGSQTTKGFHSFDVMNPHDDGISLDTVVDWLIAAGHRIERIEDYRHWLARFETSLKGLPDKQRQHSVLPLLHAYAQPERPVLGAIAPTEVFRSRVRAADVGAGDIPHIDADLIRKYANDLNHLGLV